MTNDQSQTTLAAFPCAEWLRQEGRSRDDMDAAEADWCAKMNKCADEIERLRAELAEAEAALEKLING